MLDSWRPLTCICGSTEFVELQSITWRPKGGHSVNHRGYACAMCRETVSLQVLVNRAQLDQKTREIEAMQAEIAAMQGE